MPRIPLSPAIQTILGALTRNWPFVFANPQTSKPYTSVLKNFARAIERAGIRCATRRSAG
jgi:hypothetical protein